MNEHAMRIEGWQAIETQSGYISYRFSEKIYFKVARLTYELFENEAFQFSFEPYYDVLDALPTVSIPGIDLSLRLPIYYRSNIIPVFVSERIPPKNRVNLEAELQQSGLSYWHPFLLMLDAKRVYGGDRLSVKSESFYAERLAALQKSEDIYRVISATLLRLAARERFVMDSVLVDAQNRTLLIQNYLYLNAFVAKYYDRKSKAYRRTRRKPISMLTLKEIRRLQEAGVISVEDAVQQSGAGSKSTYYRRLREMADEENPYKA